MIAPVLFGEPPESSSDAASGSGDGVEDSAGDVSEGSEVSADVELESDDSVVRVSDSEVGLGKMVCVRAVAPHAM